jgi:hypothetical protein
MIAFVAVAAMMCVLNYVQYNSVRHPEEEKAAIAKAEADRAAAAAPALGTESDSLITEETVGNPKTAKLRATLGFRISDLVARHPAVEAMTIKQLEGWARGTSFGSLQVVCLDIPAQFRDDRTTADVPMGLAINGKLVPDYGGDVFAYDRYRALPRMPVPLYRACLPLLPADVQARLKKEGPI